MITFERGDRVRYRGELGTIRTVAHWLEPADIDARLDNGRLVFDLETQFEHAEPEERGEPVQAASGEEEND